LWKTWGEESIVFNESSGSTHLLNPTAAKILSILQSQPSSAKEICVKIASQSGLGADETILQRVDVLLETLGNLGLIEPE
jgi:PqqD family protein of HPr-rel-A system